MRLLRLLFRHTLNSPVFGIVLMALVAGYIAIGSGVPSIRAYFEMDDLGFFNAWPLKVLMFLMCATLAVVTWNRIPLTPPRYGVWCIHAGIITLVFGTSLYYHLKVEGRTMIVVNHTANTFFDSQERALYIRVMNRPMFAMHPLPSLPRFASYDADHDPSQLECADLTNISKFTPIGWDADANDDLAKWLGTKDPVHLDIIGYYPYADVSDDIVEDPSSDSVGVEMKVNAPRNDTSDAALMLTSADPTARRQVFGSTELEHRDTSADSIAQTQATVDHLLQMTVNLPGKAPLTQYVTIGHTYSFPAPGYQITVDAFDPAFPMTTGEVVRTLTVHVVSDAPAPKHEFWRMILEGKTLQTDFKMDPANTPPMMKGNRQKEPIDKDLVLGFRFDDPADLMPTAGQAMEKHTFLTAPEHTLIDIHTALNAPAEVKDMTGGGQIVLGFDGNPTLVDVRREDHFKMIPRIIETPPARRNKDEAESGNRQVVMARVTCGSWSQDVAAPCDLYAGPDPMTAEPNIPWSMGVVQVPGAIAPLQLQLGYTCRPLPATITLKKFDMIHYAGGGTDTRGPFRDFRSTLEITDPNGERSTEVASLNSPVYYDDGRWIFFQASYDPDGQSSTLGVGNRPGVVIMVSGAIMMVVGLMYAFYAKPLVIRRMKASALARLGANGSSAKKPAAGAISEPSKATVS